MVSRFVMYRDHDHLDEIFTLFLSFQVSTTAEVEEVERHQTIGENHEKLVVVMAVAAHVLL